MTALGYPAHNDVCVLRWLQGSLRVACSRVRKGEQDGVRVFTTLGVDLASLTPLLSSRLKPGKRTINTRAQSLGAILQTLGFLFWDCESVSFIFLPQYYAFLLPDSISLNDRKK